MVIGFTGTRKGMSPVQYDQLDKLLMIFVAAVETGVEFHHGGALGADSEADRLANLNGYRGAGTWQSCPQPAAIAISRDSGKARMHAGAIW